MKSLRLFRSAALASLFLLPCAAQSPQPPAPIAQAPNMVPVCAQACTILTTTNPAMVLQYGVDTFWGPTFSPASLPLYVNYTNLDALGGVSVTQLSGNDPGIAAQQASAEYTITWTTNDGGHFSTRIPGLAPSAPPPGPAPTPPAPTPAAAPTPQPTPGPAIPIAGGKGVQFQLSNLSGLLVFDVTFNGTPYACAFQQGTVGSTAWQLVCITPPPVAPPPTPPAANSSR